jgi:hypothetical protein
VVRLKRAIALSVADAGPSTLLAHSVVLAVSGMLYPPVSDTARVPLVVIGEPVTERPVGTLMATELTDPVPRPSDEVAVHASPPGAVLLATITCPGVHVEVRSEDEATRPQTGIVPFERSTEELAAIVSSAIDPAPPP